MNNIQIFGLLLVIIGGILLGMGVLMDQKSYPGRLPCMSMGSGGSLAIVGIILILLSGTLDEKYSHPSSELSKRGMWQIQSQSGKHVSNVFRLEISGSPGHYKQNISYYSKPTQLFLTLGLPGSPNSISLGGPNLPVHLDNSGNLHFNDPSHGKMMMVSL